LPEVAGAKALAEAAKATVAAAANFILIVVLSGANCSEQELINLVTIFERCKQRQTYKKVRGKILIQVGK
jgi:hypothetical protein